MKIVVINGSPKGKAGNTNVMVDAFLKGAREAGAETVNVFLAEKEIEHCKGCHVCWSKGPGQCVTQDDALGVLGLMGGADVIAFASPVYFGNISGRLKVFMDRMTMIGSPHSPDYKSEGKESPGTASPQGPKLMMISSCGHPDKDEFDVTSLWIRKVAQKLHMELAGELYAAGSRLLTAAPKELQPSVDKYLQVLEKAGKELAEERKLSPETVLLLEQGIIPDKA